MRRALGIVVPVLLVGIWQLLASAGVYSAAQLPPPAEVVAAFGDLAGRGELWHHLAISTQRVLIGFAAGAGLGLALGALVGLSRTAAAALSPTIQAVRAVPSLAWVPLLLLWLGIGETPKIVLVAIGAFFPVWSTVSAALAHIDPHLVEVGRAYGRSGVRLIVTILFPAATPAILSGLRLGLAQGWLFLVAAELIASSMGLGFLLIDSQNTGRTDVMLLAIVLLAALGKLSDTLLSVAERRLPTSRTT
ncbi:ABC transporter permease [Actinoplanes sp. NPDC051494]|uniref:ABC transporter permease n=1 Tax=Actinoplanes sp. NPDC051494 TaxID=3363907 RepID=UPI0037A05DAB